MALSSKRVALAVIVASGILSAGCLVSEGRFDDYRAVEGSDASTWIHIMKRLPLDATDIHTRKNLDTGELYARFRFTATDGMPEACRIVGVDDVTLPRRRKIYRRIRWWRLRDLEGPVTYWSCVEDIPYPGGDGVRSFSYFAFSESSALGYFWANGHRENVRLGSPSSDCAGSSGTL